MSKRPPATRENHDDFCTTEGWTLVRGATGQPVRHHRTYELALPDDRILRTRISRPVDRSQYRPSMWSHILREQLEVTDEVFWDCVENTILPRRGPRVPAPEKSLPLWIVEGLLDQKVPLERLRGMSEEEARTLLHQLWSSQS